MLGLRAKGLTNRQIAAKLDVSEKVVATLIYRAKQEGMDVEPPPIGNRGQGA